MSVGSRDHPILIVAPVGRDAELLCTHLEGAGMPCEPFQSVDDMIEAMNDDVGALVVTEEALPPEAMHRLAIALQKQLPWSEVPVMILAGGPADIVPKVRNFEQLGRRTNISIIDRPVRIKSLVSSAQSALRARHRQFEVRDLMTKIEERVHERDRFLAILGHELRNPLGAILLASQMLEPDTGMLDGEHARLIERQSRHLTRLVNDLLDLSRVVSGKIVLKRQLVDLRQIAKQAMETVAETARAHDVTVELDAPQDALEVDGDPVRLDQIVTNVLTNAVKYTPDGGHVWVKLSRDDDTVKVSVRDDGVGIASDRIGLIFELFAQAENAIGRAQGGMGIGLALVRSLLGLHGGAIHAKSDGVGKGSEFVIELPAAGEMSEEEPAVAQPKSRAAMPLTRRRIVIVEDNPDVRDLLRLKLRRLGHDVDAASDGPTGVELVLKQKPHMALVDIGLPGFDGYEVARQVRAQSPDGVVLVAVSGFGQPEDKRRAFDAGFDEHITKPADVSDIESLLARYDS